MPARIVEWQLPYTWGTAINIDGNKVISLLLREENNLILVNDDNEIYTDLQLVDWIAPTDDFPVGVTVGKVLEEDWWDQNGLILNRKTTSGDYARWIYWADGEIYFDWGNGTWTHVYYSSEVDDLFTQLRGELATVAFTWDYNDLINRPEYLQQQADWNQSDDTKPDYIKNKPTIPTVNDATLTIQKNNISQWTFTANSSTNTTINISVPNVINNLTSTSTSDSLSAYQGNLLDQKIQDLQGIGRFLSLWDCSTWQPISFPLSTPYNYSTWDYFLVETVSTASTPVNYKPSGTQYTGTASSTVETDEVEVWDLYIYDGTTWLLQINHWKTVSFANLAWQPSDNAALDSALGAKQDNLTLPSTPTSWHLVTWWANNKTLVDWGAVPTVPTNVSAFTNDAWYITSASLAGNATSSTAWLVKLGSDTAQSVAAETVSATAWRTYAVQTNTSWQMLVNVPWEDAKVKYFNIHNPVMYQQDAIADVQAIWDWYHAAPYRTIIAQCIDGFLTNIGYDVGTHVFTLTWWGGSPEDSGSESRITYVTLTCPTDWNWTVQSVTYTATDYPYLSTNYNYTTPYTPTYNGSPTTKQYVDNGDTYVWSSAPSNPTEWRLWYDTANDVLKSYDGSSWNVCGSSSNTVKVFDYPSVNTDISDILSWLTSGGDVILKSVSGGFKYYYRVTLHNTDYAYIAAERFSWGTNHEVKEISYNSSNVVTSISDLSKDFFNPSNSWTQWQVLTKWSSWYSWAEPSGWIENVTTWTTSTVTWIWAWTETEYTNLGSKSWSVLYFTF